MTLVPKARRVPADYALYLPGQGHTQRSTSVPNWVPEKTQVAKEAGVAEKTDTYNGYCVKCKEKRDFEGQVAVTKTGMRMAKGPCPVCGTTVNRILGKA